MPHDEIPFGPVKIISGDHSGRIGCLDDEGFNFPDYIPDGATQETMEELATPVGIVYFGEAFISRYHYRIPLRHIREITTSDLMNRRDELLQACGRYAHIRNEKFDSTATVQLDLLTELHYVEARLIDRLVKARYSNVETGARIFISHSSADKEFAAWLWSDLKAAGHDPWFDSHEILVGQSIPQRISEGLENSDFIIVVLSEDAIKSKWLEREWHAKYWKEVNDGRVIVLPALLRECAIPELLKTKKCADFRKSYHDGLEDILLAIDSCS